MSSGRNYFLKFDLTQSSLKELSELQTVFEREGAVRACLLLKTLGAWEKADRLPVLRPVDTHWSVIKVPSLEGTELWIVPESALQSTDRRLGFDKNSESVYSGLALRFMQASYKDPIYRNDLKLEWRSDGDVGSWSGLALFAQTRKFTLEQLDMTRELGSLAFED